MKGRRWRAGADPGFPYLSEHERFAFPSPETGGADGLVAMGGNLSPGMLLSAYEQGLFPWFGPEDPILWHSPDPRFVIFPDKLQVSLSMERLLRRGTFDAALDRDFAAVIRSCAETERPGQEGGTWITEAMIGAYGELHRLGWAHSAESYHEGKLAGGCYGIRLGRAFFGESMFSRISNASKAAFLTLARLLFADGVDFIDCQVPTDHLRSLGGEEISRRDFLALLKAALSGRASSPDAADRRGNWGERYRGYSPDWSPPALH
jgi:leucyl/phenylalanyl-tRNA--protein transferase